MRVVICCMAKNEERYINDFVKFYLNLGVDTIYIYDNNEPNKDKIENFIQKKYLDKVVVLDIRGKKQLQLQQFIYTSFYSRFNSTFDWCFFVDIDEFLFGISDIKQFLSNALYDNIKQIRVRWKLFGDDNLIKRDMDIPVYNAFNKEITSSLHRNLMQKGDLEIQGKAIVKGHLGMLNIDSPHFVRGLPSCLPSGKPCRMSGVRILDDYKNESVYLHHYMTKSLSEFIEQKLNRNDAVFNNRIKLDYYWRINKKTKEKLDYLKTKGLI